MLYKRDYKLEKAKKIIESLDDSEESDLIRYYIQKKDEWIEKQNNQIKEYQKVFDLMGKFLPRKGPTVYGS